jgi:hypothetical protein
VLKQRDPRDASKQNLAKEIFEARYRHYQRAGKKDKGNILDEAAGTAGLNREHPAHKLTGCGKKQTVKGKRGPATESGSRGKAEGDRWEEHGRPCGNLPTPLIRGISRSNGAIEGLLKTSGKKGTVKQAAEQEDGQAESV